MEPAFRISTESGSAVVIPADGGAPAADQANQPGAAATPATEGAAPATQPATEGAAPAQPVEVAQAAPALPEWLQGITEDKTAQQLLQAYKSGDLKNFAQIMSTDYASMTDEDVLRIQIKEQNPAASAPTIEALLKRELSKYDLGSFDDGKNEAGKELMKLDADKVREALKQKQQSYTPPTPGVDPELQKQQEAEAAIQAKADAIMRNHPEFVGFETNRILKVGTGDDAMNLEAHADLTKDGLMDMRTLFGQLWSKGENGPESFDMATWKKILNYAKDPAGFETKLINHGKSLGSKAEFTARVNPGERVNGAVPAGNGEGSGIKWGFR